MFDLGDPFYKERPFEIALRISRLRSRSAWRLSLRGPATVLARLGTLGATARVRAIACAFNWSKPTVMKFVRLKLLLRKRRHRGCSARDPIEIEVWTARWLVGLCGRVMGDRPPRDQHAHCRVRARLAAEGPNGNFDSLGPRLSVIELARYLRCAPITIRRMAEKRILRGRRRTPCRWEFRKRDLPHWCRREKK